MRMKEPSLPLRNHHKTRRKHPRVRNPIWQPHNLQKAAEGAGEAEASSLSSRSAALRTTSPPKVQRRELRYHPFAFTMQLKAFVEPAKHCDTQEASSLTHKAGKSRCAQRRGLAAVLEINMAAGSGERLPAGQLLAGIQRVHGRPPHSGQGPS